MSNFGNGKVCNGCNQYEILCHCHLIHADSIKPIENIWQCKIGGLIVPTRLSGADAPMRKALKETFRKVTGVDAEFCFSGWDGKLDEDERADVEETRRQNNLFERSEDGEVIISVRRDEDGGIFLDRWPKRCTKKDLADVLNWMNRHE